MKPVRQCDQRDTCIVHAAIRLNAVDKVSKLIYEASRRGVSQCVSECPTCVISFKFSVVIALRRMFRLSISSSSRNQPSNVFSI